MPDDVALPDGGEMVLSHKQQERLIERAKLMDPLPYMICQKAGSVSWCNGCPHAEKHILRPAVSHDRKKSTCDISCPHQQDLETVCRICEEQIAPTSTSR